MQQEGFSPSQISDTLSEDYSQQDIDDALTQANIKKTISQEDLDELSQEAPSPGMQRSFQPQYEQPSILPRQEFSSRDIKEQIQELVESVVDEKWDDMIAKLGNISLWRETVKNDVLAIKQEIVRIESRLENLQNSVLGKVSDYNKNIKDMGSELKAIEQVLKNILQPLTTNVKELSKITEKLKNKKR